MFTINFHFLFRPKTKYWYKNTNFFVWEEDILTSVDVHSRLILFLPSSCHASTWAWPLRLRVYVINGRPLIQIILTNNLAEIQAVVVGRMAQLGENLERKKIKVGEPEHDLRISGY